MLKLKFAVFKTAQNLMRSGSYGKHAYVYLANKLRTFICVFQN